MSSCNSLNSFINSSTLTFIIESPKEKRFWIMLMRTRHVTRTCTFILNKLLEKQLFTGMWLRHYSNKRNDYLHFNFPLKGLKTQFQRFFYYLYLTLGKRFLMCNKCVFEHKVCDSCGKKATFCCSKCGIRLCYRCNVTLTLENLKEIDTCLQCGEKLR